MPQDLALTSIKKDKEAAQNALALLSHFAKGAREHLLGLPPVLPALPGDLLKDAVDAGGGAELAERFMVPVEERTALNKVWSK